MAHRIENGHVILRPRNLSRGSRMAFWICVGLAVAVVVFGWMLTARGLISAGFVDAQETFESATEAMTDLRVSTNGTVQDMAETGRRIEQELIPYVNAAVKQKEAMDLVAGIMVKNMEETYAQEEPPTEPGTQPE